MWNPFLDVVNVRNGYFFAALAVTCPVMKTVSR